MVSFIWVGIKEFIKWTAGFIFIMGGMTLIISSPFIPLLLMDEYGSKYWLWLYIPEIIIWGHLIKNN